MLYNYLTSLRTQLLLLVLLAIIPGLVFVFYIAIETRRHNIEIIYQNELTFARLVATNQEQSINEIRQLLISISHLPEVHRLDVQACNDIFATLIQSYPYYSNIGIVSPDGNIFASALPLPGKIDVSDQKWFQRTLENRDFSIGEYQTEQITGIPSINFGYPVIDDDGKLIAIVYAVLDLHWLNQMMSKIQFPEGTSLTMVDRDGIILVRYPDTEKWIGSSFQEVSIFENILNEQNEGLARGLGLTGYRKLFTYVPIGNIPKGPWIYIIISVSEELAFAKTNRIFMNSLLGMICMSMLTLCGTYIFSQRTIFRPTKNIINTTEKLINGHLSARTGINRTKGELNQLAILFDQMADTIQLRDEQNKIAQMTLIEHEQRYRQAISQANAVPYQRDYKTNRYIYMEEGIVGLIGYTPDELTSELWQKILLESVLYGEIRGLSMEEAVKRTLSGKIENWKADYKIKTKNGEIKWISDSSIPLRDKSGTPIGSLGILQDITERKRLEMQVLHSHKMEVIGTMAGGIAHDFNNLLTVINGNVEMLLKDKNLNSFCQESLQDILSAGLSASELTNQLLIFSRRSFTQFQPYDMHYLLDKTYNMMKHTISPSIKINIIKKAEFTNMLGDTNQIKQIIMNLVVNAKDAMPQGGKITIKTENCTLDEESSKLYLNAKPGFYLVLSIEDNGTGMDQETQKHIFEPFFTTKLIGKGTGLGLSNIYYIIKNHNGWINIYSEIGYGSTFKTYLPINPDLEEFIHKENIEEPVLKGNETILLIDDDSLVLKLGQSILTNLGYNVIPMNNALEALEYYFQNKSKIHLVITDLLMPGITGREIIEAIQKINPYEKIIITSGADIEQNGSKTPLHKEQVFIQKPFRISELSKIVRLTLDS